MYVQDHSAFDIAHKIDPAAQLIDPSAQWRDIGLMAGTLVETPQGWCAAEALAVGDRVFTYDGADRAITQIDRSYLDGASLGEGLVHIPGGVLNSCDDISVLPDQQLLLEHGAVSDVLGRPSCLVSARNLVGHLGISQITVAGPIETLRPIFAEDEVIWANSGLLFHCPGADADDAAFFPMADRGQTRGILALMGWTGQVAA